MATMPEKFVKQLKLGETSYEIIAGFINDGEGGAKDWADIKALVSGSFQFIVSDKAGNTPAGVTWKNASGETITGTLAANDAEYPAIYFVPKDLTVSQEHREYIPVGAAGSRRWELIGSTEIDLTQYVKIGTYAGSAAEGGAHEHNVTASGSVDTVELQAKKLAVSASVTTNVGIGVASSEQGITSFNAHTTGNALGENATFTTSVTPSTTKLSASAAGTAIGVKTSDEVLGSATTFAVTGGALTGATPASKAADTWSANTPTAIDTTKFNGGSAASFTQGSKASFTQGSKASWSATVDANGVLSFSFTANGDDTFTPNGNDSFTANTVASLGDGFYTAGTAASFKEGAFTPNVVGSVSAIGVTANSNDRVNAATEVQVIAQPTVTLASATTGDVTVATGISSASTSVNEKDSVAAITALGTANKATFAKTIEVTQQPVVTASLDGAATSGVDYAALTSTTSTETINVSGTAASAGAHTHTTSTTLTHEPANAAKIRNKE